jgi:CDP-diacylglycerol--glycerol-3-phosphate 3-phosphatidyltransferase
MLLVPLLVVLILMQDRTASFAAAAVFLAGALSDGLDGYLARRHGTSTRTGQWLDPLADKVFVAAPMVALAALDRFPLWAAVVILVREGLIAGLRAAIGVRGRSMPASRVAKWKTITQVAAITLYVLPLGSGADPARITTLLVAVALTVYTGVDYALRAIAWTGVERAGPADDPTGKRPG